MKTAGLATVAGAAFLVGSWFCTSPLAAANKADKDRAAAKLVAEVLEREAEEGVEDRGELLQPAREQLPVYEQAYWLSGLIYDAKQKKWLKLEEVEQQAAENELLVDYRQTREKYSDSLDDRIAIARWCSKHKLNDQARAHWSQVLDIDPDRQEAWRQLGYQLVDGRWLSQQENADNKAQNVALQTSLRRWSPKIEDLLDKLESSNQKAGAKALEELKAIKDPAAVPAIASIFFSQNQEAALFGIELLKNIESRESSKALAWLAVHSPWQPVGKAAAAALQKQVKHDFVPPLLAAGELPAEATQVAGNSGSGGSGGVPKTKRYIVYGIARGTSTQSWRDVQNIGEKPIWWQQPGMRFDGRTPDPVADHSATTTKQGANTSTLQKREYYTVKNDRIQTKVTENKLTRNWAKLVPVGTIDVPINDPQPQQGTSASGKENTEKLSPFRALIESTRETDPQSMPEWWDWWYDYNEVYRPSAVIKNVMRKAQSLDLSETRNLRGDCLAPDTLVATESGPVAIEKIGVGDRVYCCDPETGNLALKPVLRTIVRPDGNTLSIRAGRYKIEACCGHAFWVAGKGWVKARDLCEGMLLHTLQGTVAVDSVEPIAPQTTYSLETADLHTFFVGKEMVLTRDNTIHHPTDYVVPGLKQETETDPGQKAKKF